MLVRRGLGVIRNQGISVILIKSSKYETFLSNSLSMRLSENKRWKLFIWIPDQVGNDKSKLLDFRKS